MKLDQQLLLRIAEWKPAIEGWPDDGGDIESLARYRALIDDLELLPIVVRHDNGHEYSDTFFGLFLHQPQSGEWFEGVGLYIALSRFAPIGIYGEQRRAWGLLKRNKLAGIEGYGGHPTLDNVYRISDPNWISIAKDVRALLERHQVYVPEVDELKTPITFSLPKLFLDNANLGSSVVFDILFNDLY